MSQLNNVAHGTGSRGHPFERPRRHNYAQQLNSQYYHQHDHIDGRSSAFPMDPRGMIPQQRLQEERRRHAEAVAAAAGTGASPWLNKQKMESSRWKAIALGVALLLSLALAGILAWYFAVYKENQGNRSSSRQHGGGGGRSSGDYAAGPTGKSKCFVG